MKETKIVVAMIIALICAMTMTTAHADAWEMEIASLYEDELYLEVEDWELIPDYEWEPDYSGWGMTPGSGWEMTPGQEVTLTFNQELEALNAEIEVINSVKEAYPSEWEGGIRQDLINVEVEMESLRQEVFGEQEGSGHEILYFEGEGEGPPGCEILYFDQ